MPAITATSTMRHFHADRAGTVGVVFALGVTILLGAVGVAVDHARWSSYRSDLQAAADSAALAGAALVDADSAARIAKAEAVFARNVSAASSPVPTATFDGSVLRVNVSANIPTTVTRILGFDSLPVNVTSAAAAGRFAGTANLCILLLEPSETALLGNSYGKLDADCGVHVNSKGKEAVFANSDSDLKAASFCVVGTARTNSGSSITPDPVTPCPVIGDPLASLPEPPQTAGPCQFNSVVHEGLKTMSPGVYCGDTVLNSGADVFMQPGTYVFRNSRFIVNSASTVVGSEVMLVFEGDNGEFIVNSDGTAAISAPRSGTYKGIVMFQSRKPLTATPNHIINSHSVSKIEGTIYTPTAHLLMNSNSTANQTARYTAIIARRMTMNSDGVFTVRSDYSGSTPLPDQLVNWSATEAPRLVSLP